MDARRMPNEGAATERMGPGISPGDSSLLKATIPHARTSSPGGLPHILSRILICNLQGGDAVLIPNIFKFPVSVCPGNIRRVYTAPFKFVYTGGSGQCLLHGLFLPAAARLKHA